MKKKNRKSILEKIVDVVLFLLIMLMIFVMTFVVALVKFDQPAMMAFILASLADALILGLFGDAVVKGLK